MMQKLIIVALQRGETMDDMISRQKAIDALGEKPLAWEQGEYEEGLQTQWESDVEAIKALPSAQPYTIHSDGRLWVTVDDIDKVNAVVVDEKKSKFCKQFYMDAQPEIIRCKDCKHYGRADKRRFYRGYDCLDGRIASIVPDKDFCSRAERREATT